MKSNESFYLLFRGFVVRARAHTTLQMFWFSFEAHNILRIINHILTVPISHTIPFKIYPHSYTHTHTHAARR